MQINPGVTAEFVWKLLASHLNKKEKILFCQEPDRVQNKQHLGVMVMYTTLHLLLYLLSESLSHTLMSRLHYSHINILPKKSV